MNLQITFENSRSFVLSPEDIEMLPDTYITNRWFADSVCDGPDNVRSAQWKVDVEPSPGLIDREGNAKGINPQEVYDEWPSVLARARELADQHGQ